MAAMAASATGCDALTVAVSVARLTDASVTPGTRRSAFSTRATHEAHVMPSTLRSRVVAAPCSRGSAALMGSSARGRFGSEARVLDRGAELLGRVGARDAHALGGEVDLAGAVRIHLLHGARDALHAVVAAHVVDGELDHGPRSVVTVDRSLAVAAHE